MASVKGAVQWVFDDISNYFNFLDFSKNGKTGKTGFDAVKVIPLK